MTKFGIFPKPETMRCITVCEIHVMYINLFLFRKLYKSLRIIMLNWPALSLNMLDDIFSDHPTPI